MILGSWIAHQDDGLLALHDLPGADRAIYLLRHGTMRAGLYAPVLEDRQAPHDQDELYIIATGAAWFVKEGARTTVSQGDLIFVQAGEAHHFYDISDDFLTWVVFWGPPGGERPSAKLAESGSHQEKETDNCPRPDGRRRAGDPALLTRNGI
jgi:hypothetical protein